MAVPTGAILPPTDVTDETVQLNATIVNTGGLTVTGIHWQFQALNGWRSFSRSVGVSITEPGDVFALVVNNATYYRSVFPGTDYRYRFYASNSDGGGEWTDYEEFTADGDYIYPLAATSSASGVSGATATATLNGVITDLGAENVGCTRRYFRIKLGSEGSWTSYYEEGSYEIGAFDRELTELEPGTYYFQAGAAGFIDKDDYPYAQYDFGNINYGDELSFIIRAQGLSGHIWAEETKKHFIDDDGEERSFEATATGDTGVSGHIFPEETYYHYLDEDGDERRERGDFVSYGGSTEPWGNTVWIEDDYFHYHDEDESERNILGE